jgi:small subunit ribosomal protein S27e
MYLLSCLLGALQIRDGKLIGLASRGFMLQFWAVGLEIEGDGEQMTSEFVKVKCKKCKNEQVIFSKPASEVKCLVCGDVLAKKTGGRAVILSKVIKTVE